MNETEYAGIDRYTLNARAGGGLEMLGRDGVRLVYHKTPGGFRVEGETRSWSLESMVLMEENGGTGPAAFWNPAQAGVPAVAGGTVLLADGDLFQVLDRPGRFPGYDLKGWQGGGAHFATGLDRDMVTVTVHPAGAALLQENRGKAVLVMFVAAVAGLHTEEPE